MITIRDGNKLVAKHGKWTATHTTKTSHNGGAIAKSRSLNFLSMQVCRRWPSAQCFLCKAASNSSCNSSCNIVTGSVPYNSVGPEIDPISICVVGWSGHGDDIRGVIDIWEIKENIPMRSCFDVSGWSTADLIILFPNRKLEFKKSFCSTLKMSVWCRAFASFCF